MQKYRQRRMHIEQELMDQDMEKESEFDKKFKADLKKGLCQK